MDEQLAPPVTSSVGSEHEMDLNLVMGGGAGMIIGSFLPWATVSAPFVGSISVSGMDGGDGWITLIGGALLAFLAFRQRGNAAPSMVPLLVVAGLMTALIAYEFIDIGNVEGGGASVSYGIGLWLLGLSVVVALVGTIRVRMRGKSAPAAPPPA